MNPAQLKLNLTANTDDPAPGTKTFFSLGFRPFFSFAGVYAVLAMAAWLTWLALHHNNAVVTTPSFSVAPHLWHGHEMLFGYATAVITGFLLTAMPNWTDTPALSGRPVIFLAGIWLLGRFVVWFSATLPPLVVAIADLSHLLVLSCFVIHALSRKPAPRNLVFIALLLMLAFANSAVHAEWIGWRDDTASWGLSLAVFLFSTMIVIIGGRVVPAFTRNALMKDGCTRHLPRSYGPLDAISILAAVSLVLVQLASAPGYLMGVVAAVAALTNGARLLLWRGWRRFDQPIVWSLHLGYMMVVLGYGAVAFSVAGLLDPVAAQHVLAVGAIGCMTLAIMTRASLGHTGRALQVNKSTAFAYVTIALAAGIRALAPAAFPDAYFTIMY
ncbi:MAG: NnrS family protein, partial [Rhizobiales bacterium]|nr:NnrS family protein [Hyphomicrobiales bacterium]